jgi:hypothetical protein
MDKREFLPADQIWQFINSVKKPGGAATGSSALGAACRRGLPTSSRGKSFSKFT